MRTFVSTRLQRFLDQLTIRAQIGLLAGILGAILVIAVAWGAAELARSHALTEAKNRAGALASAMAERLDQSMFERYREITYIADLDAIRSLWTAEPAKLERALEQLQSTMPDYTWLGFAEPDGKVRAATRGLLRGRSVAARPWFKDGLNGQNAKDVHSAVLLDELLRSDKNAAPMRFVDVAAPVLSAEGKTLGVLGAHLSWAWAEDLRKTVLQRHDAAHVMDIAVFSQSGEVLVGPEDIKTVSGEMLTTANARQASDFVIDRAGEPMLVSIIKTKGLGAYPGLGWSVLVREPLAVALQPAERLKLLIFTLGGGMAVLGGVIAWLLAANVAQPITKLRVELDLVGRDGARHTIARQHGSSDVLALSTAIRSLLRRVTTAEDYVEEAQRKVTEAHVETDQFKRAVEELSRAAEQHSQQVGADLDALRRLADTDPLTGMLNRRGFMPQAYDAMEHFKRYRRGTAILMLDIDHFKRVNDTYGHAAGDEVLKMIGEIVQNQVRTTDRVARFGGEEFVVLLREIEETDARALAGRILAAVEAAEASHGMDTLRVTVSAGLALVGRGDRDIQDAIERADSALYAAKRQGRNRCIAAPARVVMLERIAA